MTGSPTLASVQTALPAHRYRQDELLEHARRLLAGSAIDADAFERFARRTGVEERHLALPAEAYADLGGLARRNEAWLRVALELGERALHGALERAEVAAGDVAMIVSATATGVCVPSLEARLMNRLGFAPTTRRLPLFGLGCAGGVAGIARAAEYVRAFPERAVAFLAVELCSLTLQPDDASIANLIAMGLFGDAAGAVVLVGPDHPRAGSGPEVLGSRAAFFPDTERVMGWDVVDTGFKLVLSPDIPRLAEAETPAVVDALLAEHGLGRGDVRAWLAHPGGPAVIDALEKGLALSGDALARTRASLARVGNVSSASVLFVLEDYLRERADREPALLLALGPAFCAETVLLR
jgi:alkylresorcinol/alkylpyrone synthase